MLSGMAIVIQAATPMQVSVGHVCQKPHPLHHNVQRDVKMLFEQATVIHPVMLFPIYVESAFLSTIPHQRQLQLPLSVLQDAKMRYALETAIQAVILSVVFVVHVYPKLPRHHHSVQQSVKMP
jgi:hypothetical protein